MGEVLFLSLGERRSKIGGDGTLLSTCEEGTEALLESDEKDLKSLAPGPLIGGSDAVKAFVMERWKNERHRVYRRGVREGMGSSLSD